MNITIKDIELLELGVEYSNGNTLSKECDLNYDIDKMYVWQGYDYSNPYFIIGEVTSIYSKEDRFFADITLYSSTPKGKVFIENYKKRVESDSNLKKEELIDFGWSIQVLNRDEDNQVSEAKLKTINLTAK
jgi:hypothetical protein